MNEDILGIKPFLVIFNSAHISWIKVDQTFTVQSLEHEEFRSVGISRLPCMVCELQAFIFICF